MNPVIKLKIDNLHTIIREIGKTYHAEDLLDIENAILDEIVRLLRKFPPSVARTELSYIQKIVDLPLEEFEPKVRPLLNALKHSLRGALSTAMVWIE